MTNPYIPSIGIMDAPLHRTGVVNLTNQTSTDLMIEDGAFELNEDRDLIVKMNTITGSESKEDLIARAECLSEMAYRSGAKTACIETNQSLHAGLLDELVKALKEKQISAVSSATEQDGDDPKLVKNVWITVKS